MLAQKVRKPVQKVYSNLDYLQFCKYMGLNPKYDMKYWDAFQKLSDSLSVFDDEQLQKIIDYAKESDEQQAESLIKDILNFIEDEFFETTPAERKELKQFLVERLK